MEMELVRDREIGSGAFSTVYLATTRRRPNPSSDDQSQCFLPNTLAIKSCDRISNDPSVKFLENEHEVLTWIGPHPNVVDCYGLSGDNLLLEYAPFGSLDRAGPRIPERVLRKYICHVLGALGYVHSRGFVHCDIKPGNILLFPGKGGGETVAKVADFGLAGRVGLRKVGFRGTPCYVSPEAVNGGECGPWWDVWAVGCLVAEMASGRKAMRKKEGENGWRFVIRIGDGEVVPETPSELSGEGKDFLSRCWARDPRERWTAEMLLSHPFVADLDGHDDSPGVSPRCHFEFAQLDSIESWGSESGSSAAISADSGLRSVYGDRMERLAADQMMPDWGDNSCSWIRVR